jgi:hypothetical protein
MDQVLAMQKDEANTSFFKFIKDNYLGWFKKSIGERPLLSPDLFRQRIFPLLNDETKVFVLVIDNLRYDQWRILSPVFEEYFIPETEELYFSILPTATMYARNSIFGGLMPSEIEKLHPELWDDDDNEGHKNQNEELLLRKQLARNGRKEKLYFEKVTGTRSSKKTSEIVGSILENDLSVMVYNFVDLISHARTEMDMIKELANNEKAYRSITLSWFNHSALLEIIKSLAENNIKLVVTTDHGAIRVNNPVKVIGDRETNSNLRYKLGKNLNYNPKQVFEVRDPRQAFLPSRNVSTSYIFARSSDFLAYPNNFNYYSNYYKDTFQHGGISLEEMIIPFVVMLPKQ